MTATIAETTKSLERLNRCSLRQMAERPLSPSIQGQRLRLIREGEHKWVNGTKLHYYFYKPEHPWGGAKAQADVVRNAFKKWKELDIGLEFEEVERPGDAEIRISFVQDDGAWSYVGREVLKHPGESTMNFGWDLTQPGEIDTAIHEIGHTLGFPHEHQNPNAGIVWDEEAVYAALAQPPNRWTRETTFFNIIRKISPDEVQGSNWDPDSIMHYPFGPGLIKKPEKYSAAGLRPAGGLSPRDTQWVRTFYPTLAQADVTELRVAQSAPLNLAPREQRNFLIKPTETRHYDIGTFGTSDTVLVLFEQDGKENRYLSGDDDSGEDRNARIRIKLLSGRTYVLRVRLYFANAAGQTSCMFW